MSRSTSKSGADEGRELGIDQHQQQIGRSAAETPVLPEHLQHGAHAGPGRLAGWQPASLNPMTKTMQAADAGTEQQEGLLTRAPGHR